MGIRAAVGQSGDINGRVAGQEAAHRALAKLGRGRVVFGWLSVSHPYDIHDVITGINEIIGNAPLLGCSSSSCLTTDGLERRSVALALIGSEDVTVKADWWSLSGDDGRASIDQILENLGFDDGMGRSLLLAADGFNTDVGQLCEALSQGDYRLAGCLSGGDVRRLKNFQVGGGKSGSGGLAVALLSGNILIGVAVGHGWEPVGALARLTSVNDLVVREIDGRIPSEFYADLFGHPSRDWSQAPLSELARMYPLAAFNEHDGETIIRSPLRIETDGSLRMNAPFPQGCTVDFMVGSQKACREAARRAAQAALDDLGPTQPKLGLVLVDAAWQTLFETNPGAEIKAVQAVLGEDVPLVGGYTYGQIVRGQVVHGQSVRGYGPHKQAAKESAASRKNAPVQLLNQHIAVVLFGEKTLEI